MLQSYFCHSSLLLSRVVFPRNFIQWLRYLQVKHCIQVGKPHVKTEKKKKIGNFKDCNLANKQSWKLEMSMTVNEEKILGWWRLQFFLINRPTSLMLPFTVFFLWAKWTCQNQLVLLHRSIQSICQEAKCFILISFLCDKCNLSYRTSVKESWAWVARNVFCNFFFFFLVKSSLTFGDLHILVGQGLFSDIIYRIDQAVRTLLGD